MPASLFSTYSTGENRVTASILAVLRSLALHRTQRILGALLGQPEMELVQFKNQVKGDASVPDAEISASFRVLIETKIKPGTVLSKQLRGHLEHLVKTAQAEQQMLLVLTPDEKEPVEVTELLDESGRLTWASFADLDQAINDLLADAQEVISEREAFLLRELQTMLDEEGLVASARDVAVVAARHAWGEYQRHAAYVCQANRPFRNVGWIAFYADREIKPTVARIIEKHDDVLLESGAHGGRLGKLVDALLKDPRSKKEAGAVHKVFILSGTEDSETVILDNPVVNDLTSESGRTVAFTMGQRYVSLEKLRGAQTTSDTVD